MVLHFTVNHYAMAGMDPLNPLASVIVFQYNSELGKRLLEPQTGESNQGDNHAYHSE